jgi:uncharacterized repeat protein (TIGR03806 family)
MNRISLWLSLAGLCAGGVLAATDPPFGLTERVPVQGLRFPMAPAGSGAVRIDRVFPHLTFASPLAIGAAPGDDAHLYVVEQRGRIRSVDNIADPATAPVFLDITDRVSSRGGEEGLLGLAFDPDYASNGFLYVNYVAQATPLHTVIARFHAAGGVADPGSEQILLTYAQPYANHNGGGLAFGPDRMLYIAAGDGGSGNDPENNGQRLDTPLGKMLRIARDGSIPPDNPFVGTSGARGEIWAYGLRNPFRFSFDRATGQLWVGDVGQNDVEEIDLVRRGGNYGWRIYEGDRSNINPDGLPASAFDAPLYTYDHSIGHTVTGGYVYRGRAIPALVGQYLYADFIDGQVWTLAQDNGEVIANVQIGALPNPSSFGEDSAGELYLTAFDGGVYKLVPNAGGPAVPKLLSRTGLFSDVVALTPSPGLVEYDVNAPLWSDGAHKRRWIALPRTQRIGFSPLQAWKLPRRTVLVKHFEVTLAGGRSRRIETRVLVHQDSGWHGYSYRWNNHGTDAVLQDDAAIVPLTVDDGAGGPRTLNYEIPGPGACLACHTQAAGFVLGLRTAQMNRTFDYGGVVDNQLRSFNHIGLFTADIGDAAQYAALAQPADANATLAARARAYLDGNCAQCHRPNGPTPVNLNLRASTPTAQMHTHGVAPTAGDLGIADARRIAPGAKERSVLWQRMRALDGNRMPPLASHAVDADGVALVGAWIDAGAH